jgi:hypothetical protein
MYLLVRFFPKFQVYGDDARLLGSSTVRCVPNIVIRDVSGGLLCYNGKVLHSFLTYKDNSDNRIKNA